MKSPPLNSAVFRSLCRVVGGQDPTVLDACIAAGWLQPLFDMAYRENLLPALAVRCNEQCSDQQSLDEQGIEMLKRALMDNTLRNMNINAQALKIARQLNRAGITPMFLKGTARLLTVQSENMGFRNQVDIDLLVQSGQLEAAGDVFLAEGYRYQLHTAANSPSRHVFIDTHKALQLSSAHHHLPLLIKEGYGTAVELHRHHLPRRFQRSNPLGPLFASARHFDLQGASFLVPSAEYQLVHLILGKLVNDGHFARRSFPIREACDFIDLLNDAGEDIDRNILEQHCGGKFALFHGLVVELMAYRSPLSISGSAKTARYIRMIQKRFDSTCARILLDTSARVDYLSHELAFSPAKLPDYLRRLIY